MTANPTPTAHDARNENNDLPKLYPGPVNGDRLEFEREWAGKDPKTRPDWPLPSFDARDWTEAFCKIANKDGHIIDEAWMQTWFANALMRGFDEGTARATLPAPQEGSASTREYLTKLILMDTLDGVEHYFGAEGLQKVTDYAKLKNRARESNQFMDELEASVSAQERGEK